VPLSVKRTITVKAIVTEELKRQLGAELQGALAGIDAELARLRASPAEAVGAGADSVGGDRPSPMHAEIARRQGQREQVLLKLKEIARLELGSEIVHGSVEGDIEVKTGDDWSRLFSAEIVLRDGMVVAIRE